MSGLKVGLKVKCNKVSEDKQLIKGDMSHMDLNNPVEIRSIQKKNKLDDTPTAVIVDSLGQYLEVYASQLELIPEQIP